jgi:hypothetical protein
MELESNSVGDSRRGNLGQGRGEKEGARIGGRSSARRSRCSRSLVSWTLLVRRWAVPKQHVWNPSSSEMRAHCNALAED